MKKRLLFNFIFFFAITSNGQSQAIHKKFLPQASDVFAFWNAYDLFWRDTTANPFEDYISKGSVGLADYIPGRIKSAEALKKKVINERNYYDKVRSSDNQLDGIEKSVDDLLASLEHLYPEVIFPKIYFVIGRITAGGTATPNGVVIGLENFSDQRVQTSTGRSSIGLNFLPSVIAHELIHFLQPDRNTNTTLLKLCILEGSADFIAELMGCKNVKEINGDAYTYGDNHEKELLKAFNNEKDGINYSNWLYNSGRSLDKPNDLGYWIGYKITESYYKNAKDKHQAIYDILHIADYDDFFRLAKYGN